MTFLHDRGECGLGVLLLQSLRGKWCLQHGQRQAAEFRSLTCEWWTCWVALGFNAAF